MATPQTLFDTGIWYALALWPALHTAVSNSWGGPSSTDKRDWFAGAVSELFPALPPALGLATIAASVDLDDLGSVLLQVMQDEFECNVEDDSEVEVALTILRLRKGLEEGNDSEARTLEHRWRNRGAMKSDIKVIDNGPQEEVDEDEFEGFSDDEEMGGVDVDMSDAPALVETGRPVKKEKPKPQVDDDGFTSVPVRRKR
nr:hypothetical protein B0A51_08793 [Rachicladosporium sp. CCFEE 5018]